MTFNPKVIADFINAVVAGWEQHAPEATFSGLTLAQFKARVQPSLDAREEIASLELKLASARVQRHNADAASDRIATHVVNSVKGDPKFGDNSALYASFGYIRQDDRKSGLTRGTIKVVPQSPELKVAA